MDRRDKPTWVVVEVNSLAEERIYEGRFLSSVRNELKIGKEHEIFTPWELVKNSRSVELVEVMEGYFFVRTGLPDHEYFNLERLDFIERVLCTPSPSSMRIIQVIGNDNVEELRNKLKVMLTCDLQKGERVVVSEGNLTNLEGDVLEVLNDEEVLIYFEFRSLKLVITMPKFFLKRVEEEEEDE